MKKSFFYVAALMLGLAFTATSCSNDDDNEVSAADIDYNSENATSWHNYMKNVGRLLQTDATNLQAAWTTGGYGLNSVTLYMLRRNMSTQRRSCILGETEI